MSSDIEDYINTNLLIISDNFGKPDIITETSSGDELIPKPQLKRKHSSITKGDLETDDSDRSELVEDEGYDDQIVLDILKPYEPSFSRGDIFKLTPLHVDIPSVSYNLNELNKQFSIQTLLK